MITPDIARLVEAVRALDLVIVVKNDIERVRLNTPPEEFPHKLLEVQKALMALDKSEGASLEEGKDDDEKEHLLKVSEALIHQIKKSFKGHREAADIVNDALAEFAGSGWVESEPIPSNGRNHTRAQERRSERLAVMIPRLTKKSIKGLDSALNDAENYRIRALERARKDMERRAQLQEALENEDGDGPDDEPEVSNGIR